MQYPILSHTNPDQPMRCSSTVLLNLLTIQWKRLKPSDIEATRYRKRQIAQLIEREYGIDRTLAEHYLTNIERTLPLAA